MKTIFNQDLIKITTKENGGNVEYDYNYFKEGFEEWADNLDITLADEEHLREYINECGYKIKNIEE